MRKKLTISLVVLALMILGAWTAHAVGKHGSSAKGTWEYKAVQLFDPPFINTGARQGDAPELTQVGDEGWELVTAVGEQHGRGYLAYLKRRK